MVKGWAADITPLYDKEIERGGMESVGEVEEEIQTSEGNSV